MHHILFYSHLPVAAYAWKGGLHGAVFAASYTVTAAFVAPAIDKHSRWFDDAAAHGRYVSEKIHNQTLGTVAGAIVAGFESTNSARLVQYSLEKAKVAVEKY